MTTVRRIVKNSGWLMASQFINNILAFIWTILLAKYLGVADFGLLSEALAATGILSVFVDVGMTTYATREIAKDTTIASRLLGNIFVIKIITSLIIIILLAVYLNLLNYPTATEQIYILIGAYMIFNSFNYNFYGFFQGLEKMEYQSITTIFNSALLFTGFLLVIFLKLDLLAFGLVYVISSLLSLVCNLIISKWKFVMPELEINWTYWKKIVKISLPFLITAIFTTIYFWIDTVMLGYIQGNEATGLYNVAYKIMLVLVSIYSVYMVSIFPVMAKYYKESSEALKLTYERSLKYVIMIILPITIGLTFFARDIILLTVGSDYLAATISMQILVWTLVFMFTNNLSTNLLSSIDKQVTVTKIAGVGAVFNIGANLVAIPILSFIGASITTVLTEFIMFLLLSFTTSQTKYSIGRELLKDFWRILIPNMLLVLILLFLKLPMVLLIVICAIVYILGVLITRALDETDIRLIKSIFIKDNLE
ncbi:flippase [Methanobacterium alcaliphilum]|uniref:flippase n=1 Tax=Methanobacterium alcaliphilum TaxID=392018 RepID=UPI00200A9948|nr:flippase [Methanobacterium alcaliphilum]MCK9150748.1 flippase [Methanobacterium alcaliphilum]